MSKSLKQSSFSINSLKKSLKSQSIWLAAIAISLAVTHLYLCQATSALSFLGTSLIFWVAVASLVWDKRDSLKLNSGLFASCFAVTLLIPLLLKSAFIGSRSFVFVSLFPILATFSLAILASGFKGLGQYLRELLALLILGGSRIFTAWLTDIDPSLLTAKFATYVLWYSGFPILRQGGNIYFASQSRGVDVYAGCSGVDAMLHLLSLALLFMLVFPTNRLTKMLLPIAAIILGFIMNGLRVALLAYLNAHNYLESFDYWHDGEGSLLFSLLSAAMLCGIAFWFIQIKLSDPFDDVVEGENQ